MFKAWAASQSGKVPDRHLGLAAGELPARQKHVSPARLRINSDLAELSEHEMVTVSLTDDPFLIDVVIKPVSGPHRNGRVSFSVKFPEDYPHMPPKVRCVESIYHPNIEPAGGVCLDILREAWTPIRSLTDVVVGLRHILMHPNATDPLNLDAAEDMMANYDRFVANVRKTMQGGEFKGVEYSKILV